MVLDQVVKFYKKANIPTITHKKAAEEIIKVAEKNYALRAISIARRSSEATKVKLEKEENELAATFQMRPKDVEKLIRNARILLF